MINAIPVIGWLFSFILNVGLALPFWVAWTVFGVGKTYAYWLPAVYQAPGFWDCVWLFIAVSVIKAVFMPRLAYVSSSSSSKD